MSIIAISRGTLSGGEALGRAVAERLAYRCLSREVLLDAAQLYGVSGEALQAVVEQPPSLWERMTGARRTLLLVAQAVLCEAAEAGGLVYHGYMGHLLLPGITHVARVRVIAEPTVRLRAVQKAVAPPGQGLLRLRQVDAERRTWIRFLFGVDWEDPLLYDLVLNLSRTTLETATHLVAALATRPEFQPTVASKQAVADLALTSRVAAHLATDRRTAGVPVGVKAAAGVVTLTGALEAPDLELVPAVVGQVRGVQAVQSLLQSRAPVVDYLVEFP